MNDRIEPDPVDPYSSYSPIHLPDDEPETTEIPALRATPPETPESPSVGHTTELPVGSTPEDETQPLASWTPEEAPRHSAIGVTADRATPLAIIGLGIVVSLVILAIGFAVLAFGPEGDDQPKKATATSKPRVTSDDGLDMSKAYTPSSTTKPARSAASTSARRSVSASPTATKTTAKATATPSSTSRTPTTKTTQSPDSGLKAVPAGAQRCGTARSGMVAASGNAQTSCAFARKVRQYAAARPGDSTMRVKSPTTGLSYTMTCTSGKVRRCTGGNGAVVYLK
ncbi:hypothetical protein [Kribbia dieselivorans]|uniref:hypothetical protein n=1 Tax=Kribbia dieselivorans TaxID=331526 RepID=UPI000837DD0D|nr:hypothetical protein [Kribbia dieselivorans]